MRDHWVTLPDGTRAIVTTSGRPSYPRCSSKGCRRRGELECDHPSELSSGAPAQPQVGDARVHLTHKRIFYVRRVHSDGILTISQAPPGSRELRFPQQVSVADWLTKSAATCSKPICKQCAVRVGALEFCRDHGGGLKA